MKTISIVLHTYNEAGNVLPLYAALREQLAALEGRYGYEIIFIDNKSQDGTREQLLELCGQDRSVKAIFNARNAGPANSSYYALLHSSGDCTVAMGADFQDPPELLPRMVEAWEQGHKIVCMARTGGGGAPLLRAMRWGYYKMIRKFSRLDFIEGFSGVGLYDRSVVELLRELGDTEPFYSGIAAELGFDRAVIPYTPEKRRAGRSSNRFLTLYDYAMRSITAYTKTALRCATLLGALAAAASFAAAVACLFVSRGSLPALGLFFMGGVQLFFIGLLGEYVVSIQRRAMKRPLVIEERRINFDSDEPAL